MNSQEREILYCAAGAKSRLKITIQSHEKGSENNCSNFSHLSFLFHESIAWLIYWRFIKSILLTVFLIVYAV